MKTQKKSGKGLYLQKTNKRWKWMAGATAATAAGVTASQASTITINLVNNYIEYNFQMKYDAARKSAGWMQQQVDDLKVRVEKSQQALVDYQRRNAIVKKQRSGVPTFLLMPLADPGCKQPGPPCGRAQGGR